MFHSRFLRSGWPVLSALLLILLIAGCGSDKSNSPSPTPQPNPALSMTVACNSGLIGLKVKNTGGDMTQASPFIALYADGHSDTLRLTVGKNDSILCDLSNTRGAVTVTNDDFDLIATADDCLQGYFQDGLGSIKLADYVPSPLTVSKVVLCTYTSYLRNLAADTVTVDLQRTAEGLTLLCVFHEISGNLSAVSPGPLCPDLVGTVTITDITIAVKIDIGAGDDPPVTLGSTQASINGLAVHASGTFGFIIDYFVQLFPSLFTNSIEDAIAASIRDQVPSDLSLLVRVNASCSD